MASFTSTQDGNWNDGATWGNTSPGTEGTDWPSTAGGDTVTVSAGHEVTIPAGHSAKASGSLADSTSGDHGKLIILGSLTLDGTLTINDYCELHVGNGTVSGTLDLDGNNVSNGPDSLDVTYLSFQGVSASDRSIIKSTTAGGTFSPGGTAYTDVDFDYVDISGLGTSAFSYNASPATGGTNVRVNYMSADNCGQLQFIAYGADVDVVFDHIDLRTPTVTDTRMLYVSNSTTPTSGTRSLSNVTASAGSGKYGKIWWDVESGAIDNLIMDEYMLELAEPDTTITNWFTNATLTPNDGVISPLAGSGYDISNAYIYCSGLNAHPIGNVVSGSLFTDSVLEGTDSETNWIISNTAGMDILRNIVIGAGTLFSATASTSYNYNIKHNTIYTADAPTAQAMLLLTEGATVLSGSVILKDNLIVDSDTTSNNTGVFLNDATADQITETDYNCWYGYSGGDLYDRYSNVVITGKTEGVDAGFGGNDLNADPQFVDKARNLAAWDASLGGAGTAANAIAELLKLNGYGGSHDANYTIANLLAYIRAGFTPQNSALASAASDGEDIGAVAVSSGSNTYWYFYD